MPAITWPVFMAVPDASVDPNRSIALSFEDVNPNLHGLLVVAGVPGWTVPNWKAVGVVQELVNEIALGTSAVTTTELDAAREGTGPLAANTHATSSRTGHAASTQRRTPARDAKARDACACA